MRYTILGFNQEVVCSISQSYTDKNGKCKILSLDVVDLLIIQEIADFMNRKKIIKYTIDDKIYFSIKYDSIIEDLPILRIKKQALRDRIDKLCELGVVEKQIIKDDSGSWAAFRLGDIYEELRYKNTGGCVVDYTRGVYLTTHGCVADYTPNNYTTITNNNNNIKELKEKFSQFVSLYKKAGGRVRGVETEFADFSKRHKDWQEIIPYLEIALQREVRARNQAKQDKVFYPEMKNLSTYLGKQRAWEMFVTIGEEIQTDTYNPHGRTIWFNEETKSYWSDDYFYYGTIEDGYTDETRPNGATLTLNNARGRIQWDAKSKEWEKQ